MCSPFAISFPPEPFAQFVKRQSALSDLAVIFILTWSRVRSYSLSFSSNQDGYDLKNVIYIRQNLISREGVFPPCSFPKLFTQSTVCIQMLDKRMEGTPRQSSPHVIQRIRSSSQEIIINSLTVFIYESCEADDSPSVGPPASSLALPQRVKSSWTSGMVISSMTSSPM